MRRLITIGLSATLLTPLASVAAAQPRSAPVEAGTTRKEVIALRGEPAERIERETKRTETWIYPGDEIVFRGDRVVEVRPVPAMPQQEPQPELPSVSIKGPSRHRAAGSTGDNTGGSDVDIGALLAEVSKVTPQEGAGAPNAPRARPGGPVGAE